MIALVAASFLTAAFAILATGKWLGHRVFAVALVPLLVASAVMVGSAARVLDGQVPFARWVWVEGLSLAFTFRADGFAVVMGVLVTGIGATVLVYAARYFEGEVDRDRLARFAGFFTMFSGSMLGLVVAGDVWTLFIFWELTSVTSFLLIGLDDRVASARAAAQRALLVTAAGGLAMLGGLVCLGHEAGTTDLRDMIEAAPRSNLAQVGLVLVLVGAFAKSAQVPLHFWLPGAMAAPTPVSAYLHSATMVKAGVVLVARLAPAFAVIGWWQPLLVIVGGSTMLAGGVAALRRDDAKQSLAFGTVSQLGLLVVVFGMGIPELTAAGIALLVGHALFKSALFMAIGAVDHATGSRDLRALSGVGRAQPVLAIAAAVCTASMIGLPPLLGFAAKEAVLAGLVDADGTWPAIALAVVTVGSALTAAYSARLWWGLFATKPVARNRAHVHHRASPILVAPVVLLGGLSLAGGVGAGQLARRLGVAAEALAHDAHLHLTVWPGFHLPLALSAGIVLAGGLAGVVVIRRGLPGAPASTLGVRAYSRSYSGLLDGARRLTLVTQSGSLPVYVAVVFAVVALVVGAALAQGGTSDWGDPVLADSVLQAAVALLAIVLAVGVVMARLRFVSVLLLGGVGQALTVLFLMYGAPDLALTQFMVETLMIVAFVLVLRHLPRQYPSRSSWLPRGVRIGIALTAGLALAWFALVAGSVDRPTDVSDTIEQLSLPAAGGSNVVNVTIVDFRGIDTMGEITVFGIAALGVANLVTASRRRTGYRGETRLAKIGAESMIFEQVTRMIFHLTLLVSVYVALRGHNAPGGGFAGGLIAGAAFVFRLLAGGRASDRPALGRVSPVVLIAVGMLLAIGTGLTALATGNEFLESSIVHVHPPLIGDVKLVSAAVFDAGVYLLVIGVVIIVLSHLASRTHAGGTLREGAVRS